MKTSTQLAVAGGAATGLALLIVTLGKTTPAPRPAVITQAPAPMSSSSGAAAEPRRDLSAQPAAPIFVGTPRPTDGVPCSRRPPGWPGCPTPGPTPAAQPTSAAVATATAPLGSATPIVTVTADGRLTLEIPIPPGFFATGPDGKLWLRGATGPWKALLREPSGRCVSVSLFVEQTRASSQPHRDPAAVVAEK